MIRLNHKTQKIGACFLAYLLVFSFVFAAKILAENKQIVITKDEEAIAQRMDREITLDVRDMNVVDVIKFLALKGEFNVVVSPTVQGRSTVLLNNVKIKDSLDIIVISNNLAYKVEGNIVHIMPNAEYESMYGERFGNKAEVKIVRLQYSKPSYVLAALDNLKSNVGKVIIDEDTGSVVMIDTKEALARMIKAIEDVEKPLETFVYTLQYAKADVVAEKLKARIDAKAVGSVTADERSNQVIVRALPGRAKEVEQIIAKLDTPTKEVLVDARVLQITFNPQYDVGIDWKTDFGSKNKFVVNNNYANIANMSGADNLKNIFGDMMVGNFSKDVIQADIRALEKVSDTKIISNPKLLVTNNEEAKIHIGDTVPYIVSTTSGTGDNAITSEDVRFVDVGLKLNVTPVINDNGFVTMRLQPEISTVSARLETKSGGIPQVNKTLVETTVMVKDGYTIILGGLKKNDKNHSKSGLPVLKDIPLLGVLFGRTSDTITQTEIVIFITPTIIKSEADYKAYEGGIKPFKSYSSDI
ncbi:MAG: type II secretion system protein GspD [Candidatus Omnitrophica bacterium]|nr:type II secretion system protein GspD [Candidatus Omnitrophota bacterium]